MGSATVLLIESSHNNGVSFSDILGRKYDLLIAHSGKQGLAKALEIRPDVIVLDAASLRTSGDRIAARLRACLAQTPIIHIKSEEGERGQSVADLVLFLPFTGRKLSNRIDRFTNAPKRNTVQKTGLFSLNPDTQTLSTPWSEKKLTPKLMKLAELFLQNPGQVLERKNIMQQVWETDYVEDTRTLDVHIRWLRQVIEPNPRKPQYLVTVRGKGYRFEVLKEDNKLSDKKSAPTPPSKNEDDDASSPSSGAQ